MKPVQIWREACLDCPERQRIGPPDVGDSAQQYQLVRWLGSIVREADNRHARDGED
jgi:hypothetical protein